MRGLVIVRLLRIDSRAHDIKLLGTVHGGLLLPSQLDVANDDTLWCRTILSQSGRELQQLLCWLLRQYNSADDVDLQRTVQQGVLLSGRVNHGGAESLSSRNIWQCHRACDIGVLRHVSSGVLLSTRHDIADSVRRRHCVLSP